MRDPCRTTLNLAPDAPLVIDFHHRATLQFHIHQRQQKPTLHCLYSTQDFQRKFVNIIPPTPPLTLQPQASYTMALPVIKSIIDCSSLEKTVYPYLPQLYDLPQQILQTYNNPTGLKNLYLATNPLISACAFSLFLAPLFLIVSEINKNYSQVDRLWSILPTIYNGQRFPTFTSCLRGSNTLEGSPTPSSTRGNRTD